MPVSKNSGVCIDGPYPTTFCPSSAIGSNTPTDAAGRLSTKYCGWGGTCDSGGLDPTKTYGACNSLSGVNSGLPCNDNINDDYTGYHVCHNAPMRWVDNVLSPQYTYCELDRDNWLQDENVFYHCLDKNCQGMSKKEANDFGAYRCAKGAVELESIWQGSNRLKCDIKDNTLVNGNNQNCPKMVLGVGSSDPYLHVPEDPNGYIHSSCVGGRCNNGFESAKCTQNVDCQFTSLEYWGGYNAEKPWGGAPDLPEDSSGQLDLYYKYSWVPDYYGIRMSQMFCYEDLGNGRWGPTGDYSSIGECSDISQSNYHVYKALGDDAGQDFENKTTQGNTWWITMSNTIHGIPLQTGAGDKGPGQDLGGKNLTGAGFVKLFYQYASMSGREGIDQAAILRDTPIARMLKRYPGAYAAAVLTKDLMGTLPADQADNDSVGGLFIPGHCEKPPSHKVAEVGESTYACDASHGLVSPVDDEYCSDDFLIARSVAYSDLWDRPYEPITWLCNDTDNIVGENFNPDDYATYANRLDCRGLGVRGYQTGSALEPDEWRVMQRFFGDPVFTVGICTGGARAGSPCTTDDGCIPSDITQAQIDASSKYCKSPTDLNNPDVAKICKPDVSYLQTCNPNSTDLDSDCYLCTHGAGYYPRTDLCGGDPLKAQCLTGYKLSISNKDSVNQDKTLPPTDVTPGFYTPDYLGWNQTATNFNYLAYYSPRPPKIAAPDLNFGCTSPGSCPVTQWDAFSLDNQSEGILAYMGGQAMTTMRFYGWAAHDQGALKDMWIDWGDSNEQEFHDVKMKNRKPFCNVGKECQFVPGLTCTTDNDCPPAGGKCADVGFCQAHQYQACSSDLDCDQSTKDKCVKRIPFGDTEMACEQNYFEFTHVYSCGKEMRDGSVIPFCQNNTQEIKRCSRENSRICTSDSQCGAGDKCLSGLAPPGGCYDTVKSSCRFTPRILLKDSWGWCTGECRKIDQGSGVLGIGAIGSEPIIFKNGGCYDGSMLTANTDPKIKILPINYCDPKTDNYSSSNKWIRPWIVYKGALQLGVAQ